MSTFHRSIYRLQYLQVLHPIGTTMFHLAETKTSPLSQDEVKYPVVRHLNSDTHAPFEPYIHSCNSSYWYLKLTRVELLYEHEVPQFVIPKQIYIVYFNVDCIYHKKIILR